jgi:hypothetical protein
VGEHRRDRRRRACASRRSSARGAPRAPRARPGSASSPSP